MSEKNHFSIQEIDNEDQEEVVPHHFTILSPDDKREKRIQNPFNEILNESKKIII